MINVVLLCNLLVMIFITICMTLLNYQWVERNIDLYDHIFYKAEPPKIQTARAFGSFYLLNNSFLPLDLAVGLEMGRFMYMYFIELDAHMTVVDLDKREAVGAIVKNFSLHEDLAQLDYIFCDKTGTLT